MISRVGGVIKESLANGQALDKVESILKLYAGIKLTQALAPFAGAGFSAMGGAFGGRGGRRGGSCGGTWRRARRDGSRGGRGSPCRSRDSGGR